MLKVYGIPNCDTVKKVFVWLKEHNKQFEFHDYKKEGAPVTLLQAWTKQKDWNEILNKKSTTWRELPAEVQFKLKDAKTAIALMHEHTSLIKRPVIEKNGKILAIGFKEADYEKLFI